VVRLVRGACCRDPRARATVVVERVSRDEQRAGCRETLSTLAAELPTRDPVSPLLLPAAEDGKSAANTLAAWRPFEGTARDVDHKR
jgi:hypothetical protein